MSRLYTLASLLSAALSPVALAGGSSWVVWSQPQSTNWAIVPSYLSTDPAVDVEIADDFEIVGSVSRIVATGYDCFNCATPDVAGAYVRFYEWTPFGPGAMVDEQYIVDGDPGLLYGQLSPATLDITLPNAFTADGKHFVSVQLAFNGGGSWEWWITNNGSPNGSEALTRDRSQGPDTPWTSIEDIFGPLSSDVTFMLWGDDGTPPPPGTDPCGPWSVVPSPDPAGTDHAILRDVHAIAPDDVWAVGEYTAVVQGSFVTLSLAEHWDGVQWAIVPTPNPAPCPSCANVFFSAVDASGPNDVWAAGGKLAQGPDGFVGTHIYVARYDGTNWTVMNTPLTTGGSGSHVQDIEVLGSNDVWFFGDYISGSQWSALAMHWNGSSFTIHTTPFPAGGTPGWGLEGGSALSSNDIWAVGGGSDGDYTNKGYIIHWDGSSWTRVQGPTPGTYQRLYAVKAIASDDVWAVGDYFVAGSGYFSLFLHWDGSSWTQVPSPAGGSGLVAFGSDNIYASGGGIVHWDGTSWQLVEDFDSVIGASATSISASTLCDMWAVGREIVAGDLLTFTAHLHPVEVGEFSPTELDGDIDGDGAVNSKDLAQLLGAWGPCPQRGACVADIDDSGNVDAADLAVLLAAWTG